MIFQPHQKPEQRNAGKSVQFGKAEADQVSVHIDLNIFCNLTHKASNVIYYEYKTKRRNGT